MQENWQQLLLPGRLIGEALAQDDHCLSLEECCTAGVGSADYDFSSPQFTAEIAGKGLPNFGAAHFTRQGMLPEIQRFWRSFDSRIVLWKYADLDMQEMTDYTGVSQQVIAAAVVRPKDFVVDADYFLILATPLEVSLHALRFAPGSDRLLQPMPTQYAVATDDVLTTALAADAASGRIFLGGNDGCIHELQYSEDESSWLRRPRKCRKVAVSWNLQSQLPVALQRICVTMFGQSESVVQLATESSRGLLIALSSLSNISIFHVPAGQRNSQGRLEEKPVVQLCSITQSSIASEVGRIKARLFPGLLAANSRGLNPFGAVAAATGLASQPPRLVKVWPVEKTQGGSIVACAVAEDGTRVFLKGVFRASSSVPTSDVNSPGNGTQQRCNQITSVAVHHVRFLDALAPKNLRVKDALWEDGVTLLQCQVSEHDSASSAFAGGRAGGAEMPEYVNAVVVLSTDLRVIAQRQGRNRSPWLQHASLAEHVDTVHLHRSGSAVPEILGIAMLPRPVSKPVEQLFSKGNGLVLPVLHLSELAKQQLVPAPSFIIISGIGAHILRKTQPINVLQGLLLNGNMEQLQDFVNQFTAEQVCAMCFQTLTQAMPKISARSNASRPDKIDASSASRNKLRVAKTDMLAQPSSSLASTASLRDPAEEVLLLRTEQFLLSPQLSVQMGFSQVLPALQGPQMSAQTSPLGYPVMFQSAARLSARLRGLYSYLSRLIRPFWLSPVMLVSWPPAQAEKPKRKRPDEWWPPPPDPAPVAKGAQWRCAFSKPQRSYAQSELSLLKMTLDRCLPRLVRTEPGLADGGFAGASISQEEVDAAQGALRIVAASLEALDFLDLLSGCTAAMSSGSCPAEVLQRFSELTFRDLVCQPEAQQVLQRLMQAGVVASRDLSRCPTLFSQSDLEIQESFEVLRMVQESLTAAGAGTSMLEIARLSNLTHRALSVLERHAARVNLTEAAGRLRAVGACKGLVALCSSVAKARDSKDEAMRPHDASNPRIQQLHYARLECYQIVLGILDDFLSFARQRPGMQSNFALLQPLQDDGGGSARILDLPELLPSHIQESDATSILDALLRHCLEGRQYQADELFHFCVLKWMMQSGLPPYRYKSPYLKNFLQVHAKDDPEILCRYLQHNGRWAEACDAYLSLARDSGTIYRVGGPSNLSGSQQQILLLQKAAMCARMPHSNRRVEPILRMMTEVTAMRTESSRETPDMHSSIARRPLS